MVATVVGFMLHRLFTVSAIAILVLGSTAVPFAQAAGGTGTPWSSSPTASNLPAGCSASFADDCYHMRGELNALDSPVIDVLLVVPPSTLAERDLRAMHQVISMYDAGIDYLALQQGLNWLADGVEFHVTPMVFDPVNGNGGEFTTYPIVDPEIVVIRANPFFVPVGLGAIMGIGIDPLAGLVEGPCHGLANPFDLTAWEAVPGFDSHHGGRGGTYVEDCGGGGGNICFAVNGGFEVAPDVDLYGVNVYDLVAHEVGHCLRLGHVGDAGDHTTNAVPFADIMSYTDQTFRKCVSSLDVEQFAVVMSPYLDVNLDGSIDASDRLYNNDHIGQGGNAFQVQHPDDHVYASSTGLAADCPQPDLGIEPLGEPVNFYPSTDATASLSILSPEEGSQISQGANGLTVTGQYDCGAACPPSPLTGSTNVYQAGLLNPFAASPEQTTIVAGTFVDLSGRFIKTTDAAAYPLATSNPARITLYDGLGQLVFTLPAANLAPDCATPCTNDADPDDFAVHVEWQVDAQFPAGDYRLAVEVGNLGANANEWWGIPSIPLRIIGPAVSTTGSQSNAMAHGGQPASGPLDLPVGPEMSTQSWQDPNQGGNGDYVFIDSPPAGEVSGVTNLAGRAGTSTSDPNEGGCGSSCGGGGGFQNEPQVVIAMIDTGGNPYHAEFRDESRLQHPSEYLTQFPSNVDGIRLCFVDEAAGAFSYDDDCSPSWAAARTSDASEWATVGNKELAWFPGTRLMGISFAHDGQVGYNVLDGTRDLGDSGDTHGTWVSSTAIGNTVGTCPECLLVIIEADTVQAIDEAYMWAAQQPWIDVITSSISVGVSGVGWNPGIYPGQDAGAREAAANGKIFFEAAGNGVANAGVVPTSTFLLNTGSPSTIAVGSNEWQTGTTQLYHDFPVEITGTGHDRASATPGTFTAHEPVPGTSFAAPSAAGVAARALWTLRDLHEDFAEGASGPGKTLLRSPATIPGGPFANGVLTAQEFREVVTKTAVPPQVGQIPWWINPVAVPDSPASFVKEGYGEVNWADAAGDVGINWHERTTYLDIAAVIQGTAPLPQRMVEEFYLEQIVRPLEELVWSPYPDDADGDAYPENAYPAELNWWGTDAYAVQPELADFLDSATKATSLVELYDLLQSLPAAQPFVGPLPANGALHGESDPIAGDGAGDGTVPGSDIGNVWVDGDDGTSVQIHLRLHEEPTPTVPLAMRAEYGVDLTQGRTGVDYALRAQVDALGAWSFSAKALTADGGTICTLTDVLLQDSQFEDGVLTFHLDYADLTQTAPPTATGVTCTLANGDVAVAGDELQSLQGISSHVIGLVDFGAVAGDQSDLSGTYTLAGDDNEDPACPQVCITVNGQDAGTATITGEGEWERSLDFTAWSSPYVVTVTHGTATDQRTFVAEDGTEGGPRVTLVPDANSIAAGQEVTFSIHARHVTGANGDPTAGFSFTSDELLVSFDAAASSDPDDDVLSFEWDFGDAATGAGMQVQHEFAASGDYEVTLTIDDGNGGMDQLTQTVSVALSPSGPVELLNETDPTGDALSPAADVRRTVVTLDESAGTVTIQTTFEAFPLQAAPGNQLRNNGFVVVSWYFDGVHYEAYTNGNVWNYGTGAVASGMSYVQSGPSNTLTISSQSPVYQAILNQQTGFSLVAFDGKTELAGFVDDDYVPDTGQFILQASTTASLPALAAIGGPEENQEVEILVNGQVVHVEEFTRAQEGLAGYEFDYRHGFSTAGTYDVEVRFIDFAGNDATDGPERILVSGPTNQAPTANAGPDQEVQELTTVQLVGSGSDTDGTIESYAWTQIAGPVASLANANTAAASFAAPTVDSATALQFRLTVTDNLGGTGTDTVSVMVRPAPPEHANELVVSLAGHETTLPLPASGGTWTVQLSGLAGVPLGLHPLLVTAYNAEGLQIATDQINITVAPADQDGDGIADDEDPCPTARGLGTDEDGDGTPDECDEDNGFADVTVLVQLPARPLWAVSARLEDELYHARASPRVQALDGTAATPGFHNSADVGRVWFVHEAGDLEVGAVAYPLSPARPLEAIGFTAVTCDGVVAAVYLVFEDGTIVARDLPCDTGTVPVPAGDVREVVLALRASSPDAEFSYGQFWSTARPE